MDVIVLNTDLEAVSIVDECESFIWTDRYQGYGDFELYTNIRDGVLNELRQDYYLQNRNSDHVMIIEKIQITSDVEDGNHVTVTGRSLESILDRRIVWKQTRISGNLQNGIRTLLDENVISPSDSNRKISNFIFKASTDPAITKLTINAQYTGKNLYDVIQKICEDVEIGFRLTLNDNKQFVFELYAGTNRSYDQTENPYVIFSPKFENIINSNYIESKSSLKTITLVGGEGEGSARRYITVGDGSGLYRRELFTDARDIQSDEYSDKLQKYEESLTKWEESLKENEQELNTATDEFDTATSDYSKVMDNHESFLHDYNIRMDAINVRINDYVNMEAEYVTKLTESQRRLFEEREHLKAQADEYAELINTCSTKISSYNNKIRNERTMTYVQLISYEEVICNEEKKKTQYEDKQKEINSEIEAIEKELPNYESQLKEFESKISEYEDILENDKETVESNTKEYDDATSQYQSTKSKYEENKSVYDENIEYCKSKIAMYQAEIIQEQKELDVLIEQLLTQRGTEELGENTSVTAFEGETETTIMFKYGEDFFNGDIVQIANEYGHETKARILEIVTTENEDGTSVYPTFKTITDEGGDEE